MEKELDSIKAQANDARRDMISMARKEALLLREKLIQDASKNMEQKSGVGCQRKMKRKQTSLFSKAEDDIRMLKKKIDSRFDNAVDSVRKALLSE